LFCLACLQETGFTGTIISVMGNESKPDVVIEVVGIVPVSIRTADVPMIIVPGAAAIPSSPSEAGGQA
jgi:hypothetical protein